MIQLTVAGSAEALAEIGMELEAEGAAAHIALAPGLRPAEAVLLAELRGGSADQVLGRLAAHGVDTEAITLTEADEIGLSSSRRSEATLVWAEVLGQAARNARPIARFLVFMATAGIIAGFGVIEVNAILVVGAMAISPDALPITAACVGLVGRRWDLTARAAATLALGLAMATVTACLLTVLLHAIGEIPPDFKVGESALDSLTTVSVTTAGVALAAGVAGMLAVETHASAAVGVAISVTTIPAAAYLGVAAALGETGDALGALAVLGVNVAMLLVGGVTTLLTQRALNRRLGPASAR